jgi:hypothetical protein
MSFLSHLRAVVRSSVARKKVSGAPLHRPALEVLEDRCAPASLSGSAGPDTPYGVTIELLQLENPTGHHSVYTLSQTTTPVPGSGAYSFTGLKSGVYEIKVVDAVGATAGTVNNKPDGSAIPLNGYGAAITNISLGANDSGVNYDFTVFADTFVGG